MYSSTAPNDPRTARSAGTGTELRSVSDGRPQLLLVLLTLVALSILPFLSQRRIDRLREEINEGADPALATLATVTTEVALEAAARRGFLLTRDVQIAGSVTASRERRRAALRDLEDYTRSLGDRVETARNRLLTRLSGVDAQLDSLQAQGTSSRNYAVGFDEREAQFTAAMTAADSLRAAIHAEAESRRGSIQWTEKLDFALTSVLVVLGIAAAAAAWWLESRVRSTALALETRRRELERVTESRARLIRGFTHDLKNPLGGADGHLALLEDGIPAPLDPLHLESVARARRSIRVALDLIGQLLELARAEAGHVTQRRQTVLVAPIAREVVDEFKPMAKAKDLKLTAQIPESLPSIVSDESRVRQIASNLVSNAVKYTPIGGCVEVRAFVRAGDGAPTPGEWLGVEVADTGRGIAPEDVELLFQEFTRFDPEAASGSGIGLAISERLARGLGGSIAVESTVGRGSRFTLWLPVSPTRS